MNGDDRRHDIAACARAWQTLRIAHNQVAERLESDLSHECRLTINEFDVMLYLRTHQDDEVRITALLGAVSLSQPALSRLVARLEARGLLARSTTEADARASLIWLTEAGTHLIDHAIQVHAAAVHETLTSKLSDDEQAALLDLLAQVGR